MEKYNKDQRRINEIETKIKLHKQSMKQKVGSLKR
jgi:tetrahydromethanopterin S-methyltransferase subunit G